MYEKSKKGKKVFRVGVVLGCTVGFSFFSYNVIDNAVGDIFENITVVEAKGYAEPNIENHEKDKSAETVSVAGDTQSQNIVKNIENSNVVMTSSVVNDIIEIGMETDDTFVNKPVEIEYIDRSEYTGVIPNEMNEVVIAMYHGISDKIKDSDTVHRSIKGFKEDLELLYKNGYRPITMEDLMTNNIEVEEGYTPIVLTFDDGLSTSFSMERDSEGNLIPKENTAVDIINDFNAKYPDFETHALFYIYTSQRPFKGEGTFGECAEYLLENGYEIGGHTYSHPFLSELTDTEIQMQMGYSSGYISKHTDGFKTKYVAYPYGVLPNEESNIKYVLEGKYEDFSYNFHSGVLAAPNSKASTLIYSNDFDRYKVGRYRGTNNDMFDLNWKINNDAKKDKQFVSDGDPNTITIWEDDFDEVNLDTLNNKKLIVITN